MLVSAVLLLDIGAFMLLVILSMSYGDVTHLQGNEAYERFERGVLVGWWLWKGINAAALAVLLYRVFRRILAYQEPSKG